MDRRPTALLYVPFTLLQGCSIDSCSLSNLFPADLHLAFTASEHRRKGVASKYLQWGVDKADELGLESYLEASTLGAPAYRKFGFIDGPIVKAEPKMPEDYTDEQKAEWEELAKSQLPSASLLMWRPVKGEFVEGKTVPPWSR